MIVIRGRNTPFKNFLKRISEMYLQFIIKGLEYNCKKKEVKDMKYVTYFGLTNPVNEFEPAEAYLKMDDMTYYIKNDMPKVTADKIDVIVWNLVDEQNGYIMLRTNTKMTDDELSAISEWVSGQNSDGLGEGFEQQPFATHPFDEDDENSDIEMSSFDWETNEYKFTEVKW